MKIDPNSPAFPNRSYRDPAEDFVWPSPGLTVRAHFAAMAMQGLMACAETAGKPEEFAKWSVDHADALIAELNKEA